MNWGLSDKLKTAFPDVIPEERPLVENPNIPHPNWLAWFTAGEGCFFISLSNSQTKVGSAVRLEFKITQH